MWNTARVNAVAIVACQIFGVGYADSVTTVQPKTTYGVWEGWGVSLAWWAQAFGNRNDLASAFFSMAQTNVNGQSLPGLGFNIARYNAGACSPNSVDGSTMVQSPDIIPSRQMSGFWLNYTSSSPTSSSWSWSVDQNQRNMLQLAQNNGATILELFSNSPMWWMCYNHNPSGSNDGSSDNLQSWNYDQHAVYLATVAAYAKSHWGVQFTSVEAFNEPSSNWWNGQTGTQEGCHFDASTQAKVIPYLRSELDSRGLQNMMVSASDENTYDLAISTWQSLGTTATSKVGRINVHGYQYSGGRRDTLYSVASGAKKALWNSEYGDGDGSGTGLVQNLLLDLYWLHPTAWVYWQAIDGDGWGLINGNNDKLTLGSAEKKYYALAQFSRHIRPGMVLMSTGNANVAAAYGSSQQKLILVAANWNSAGYLNFDLSQFSSPGKSGALVPRWSTQINGNNNYAAYSDTYMSGTQFWSYFQQGEVQTFEISNVAI